MRDPLRIVEEYGNEQAGTLLRAEAGELPPPGAEERLLATLGIVVAAGTVASGVTGATALRAAPQAARWWMLSTNSWLVAALIGGALAVVVGIVITRVRPASSVDITPHVIEVESSPPVTAPIEPATPPAAVRPEEPAPSVPRARPSPARGASADSAETLKAEIVLLDGARAALAEGHPSRALEILSEYHDKFPSAHLEPEAFLIRLDALVRSGDAATAQRLARDYLADHPTSPHASRVRRIVGP